MIIIRNNCSALKILGIKLHCVLVYCAYMSSENQKLHLCSNGTLIFFSFFYLKLAA